MAAARHRVILDTNILVRGLINLQSASGQIVDACDTRSIVLILSKPVLAEYRAVLRVFIKFPQSRLISPYQSG